MYAYFNRFDICAAHKALEADWHSGGWLQERPSNRRRREATSIQLERIGYSCPLDSNCSFESLESDNARAIYVNALQEYGLRLEFADETHADIINFIASEA